MNSKIDYTKLKFSDHEIELIKKEVDALRTKFPQNIPIVVRCKGDVELKKYKYLVNGEITVAQFLMTLRKKLEGKVKAEQGLYLFVGETLPPSSELMHIIYNRHKDPKTNMLFFTLCSENTFGY